MEVHSYSADEGIPVIKLRCFINVFTDVHRLGPILNSIPFMSLQPISIKMHFLIIIPFMMTSPK
jgi:hypothetical protein